MEEDDKPKDDKSKEQIDPNVAMQGFTKWIRHFKPDTYSENYYLDKVKAITFTTHIKWMNIFDNSYIILRVTDSSVNKSYNFAIVTAVKIVKTDFYKKTLTMPTSSSGYSIKYYCIYPNFVSSDGEYHQYFNTYFAFTEAKTNPIYTAIDNYLVTKIHERKLVIYNVFYHNSEVPDIELENYIRSEVINYQFFKAAWFVINIKHHFGVLENHINENAKEIMLKYYDIDKPFIGELIKEYTFEKVVLLVNRLEYARQTNNKVHFIQNTPVGYKLLPLNVFSLKNPFNIRNAIWREWIIGFKTNAMLFNSICYGFPFYDTWSLILNTNSLLFDNDKQYAKLKNSELAKHIITLLEQARDETYLIEAKEKMNHVKKWFSSKFKKLNDAIDDAIEFTLDEIIMSGVTLFIFGEYVGRTFADTYSIRSSKYLEQFYVVNIFNEFTVFSKYLFDIIYNLLCLNKLGVIHGDLHLNNVTIGVMPELRFSQTDEYVKHIVGENEYYLPIISNGYVIDLSRAIINPNNYDNFMMKGIQVLDDYEKFEAEEVSNLVKLYYSLFPKTKKDDLTLKVKQNISEYFKLFSCIDTYVFISKIMVLSLEPQMIELCVKIHKHCEVILTENVGKGEFLTRFPNDLFLEHFEHFKVKREKISTELNVDNKIVYNMEEFEKFPPYLREYKFYDLDSDTFISLKEERKLEDRRKQYENEINKFKSLAYN